MLNMWILNLTREMAEKKGRSAAGSAPSHVGACSLPQDQESYLLPGLKPLSPDPGRRKLQAILALSSPLTSQSVPLSSGMVGEAAQQWDSAIETSISSPQGLPPAASLLDIWSTKGPVFFSHLMSMLSGPS